MRAGTRELTVLGVVGMIAGATPAHAAEVRATSSPASPALLADGRPSFGEWSPGPSAPGVRMAVSSDDQRLHVLLDALDVRSTDDVRAGVIVDVNRDRRLTPNLDLIYQVEPEGSVTLLRVGGRDSPPTTLPTESSAAVTRDCFAADGTRSFAAGSAAIHCDAHQAAEFALELSELGVEPGETVNLAAFLNAGSESVRFPAGRSDVLTEPLVVDLRPEVRGPAIPPPAALELAQDPGLEILQSTEGGLQDPLVADKPTIVRVLPRVANPARDRHPATVRLHGRRDGVDLPGSPLSQPLQVRANPDRMVPADGATFLLPKSWIKQGTLSLLAWASQTLGPPSPVAFDAVPMVPTFKTSVWTLPLEAGFGLPTAPNMATQESRTDTILPVADMYFPRRAAMPASGSSSGAVDAANTVYAGAKAAWAQAKEETGTAPYRLPRQVWAQHHESVSNGGLSDPVWHNDGGGVATGGDTGTSQELTMAHEIDHNLDRKATPTWGGHIGGCDADDDDAEWPWPDLLIHERGYDVPNLLPVDTDENDLMSYCRKDTAGPAKWIGLYRWTNLLSVFRSDPATASSSPAAAAQATDPADLGTAADVLQISGAVDRRTRAVSLDPVFRGPGVPDAEPGDESGETYALEVLGAGGARRAVRTFDASFRDVEGGLRRQVRFGFDLLAPGDVREVRVVRVATGRVLARRVLSASAPRVRIVAPNGGEQLPARPFDLVVDARDPDGDALAWRIQASGDGGATWLPVTGEPRRGRLRIDPSTLPGGASSLLRVVATDGLRTSTDESDAPFALPVTPPQPSIRQPLEGARLRAGQVAVLRGNAVSSSLQELPAENLLWFDGDRLIAEGEEARVLLAPGTHRLRFVAVDAVGQVAGASQVTFDVGGACGEDDRRRGRGHERHGSWRGEGHVRHGDGVPCGTVVPGLDDDGDEDEDEGRDP